MSSSSDRVYHIVGAGITGAVCALLLKRAGRRVIVHEASDMLGGLCASKKQDETDVHLYGPHIYHTDSAEDWTLMRSVAPFQEFHVQACIKTPKGFANMPLTPGTVRLLTDKPYEAAVSACILAQQIVPEAGETLLDWCRRALPEKVADICVLRYSEKVWGCPADTLPATLFRRLPIYSDESRNYHADRYSGVPRDGWSAWFSSALRNIEVRLLDRVNPLDLAGVVIYTGPLDEIPGINTGVRYHEARFSTRITDGWDAPTAIVHDPCPGEVAYRVTNYTKLTTRTNSEQQVLGLELTRDGAGLSGTPVAVKKAYPVPGGMYDNEAKEIMTALSQRGVVCVGRLAGYSYSGLADCVRTATRTIKSLLA